MKWLRQKVYWTVHGLNTAVMPADASIQMDISLSSDQIQMWPSEFFLHCSSVTHKIPSHWFYQKCAILAFCILHLSFKRIQFQNLPMIWWKLCCSLECCFRWQSSYWGGFEFICCVVHRFTDEVFPFFIQWRPSRFLLIVKGKRRFKLFLINLVPKCCKDYFWNHSVFWTFANLSLCCS